MQKKKSLEHAERAWRKKLREEKEFRWPVYGE